MALTKQTIIDTTKKTVNKTLTHNASNTALTNIDPSA